MRRTVERATLRRRNALRTATAAALGLSVLGGLVARAAFAGPATPAEYPRGTSGTSFSGLAFDACDAPSRQTMAAWKAGSPFGALGIYISGEHRACDQRQLSDHWVRDVTLMGWKLLPLDVGRQAPCMDNPRLTKISRDLDKAREQGASAARTAVTRAMDLAIRPGSPIYADIEFYAGNDAGCSQAVRAYVSGWTRQLHALGYLSGVYGNANRVGRDLAASYENADFNRPDAIWAAQWNNVPNVSDVGSVPGSMWANRQRVKQYRGDHRAEHGGVALTIDANAVDGPVATVGLLYSLTGQTIARLRPSEIGLERKKLAAGDRVQVICQSPTAAGVWDKLQDGSYVPDAVVDNGSAKPSMPTCATPFQVATGGVNLRTGPVPTAQVVGTMRGGTLAWVICETPGTTLGRPGFWAKLDTGHWVSGPLLARPSAYERAFSVPLCSPA